jgi:DNA-directed RNA polymerase specialized sigma subunit
MRFLINRLPAARFWVDKAMARATKTTTVLTGMPRGSGTGDQTADGAILLQLAREALDRIETELSEMRAELGPMIEQIDEPLQKSVMRLRYMDGMRVREIAYSLNYSEPHIFRILQRAEQNIISTGKDESDEST